MSQRHAPRHSSSDTLAQDKITGIRGGTGPGHHSDWARDSEEESLGPWRRLVLYPGEMSITSMWRGHRTAAHAQQWFAQRIQRR